MAEEIDFGDFAKVDMRMGEVLKAEVPEGSKSVIKLTVLFGEELGERTIFAGIKNWYSPEDIEGKVLPFVVNMKPKKMGGLGYSQGMVLAASPRDDQGKESAVLLMADKDVKPGTRLR